MEAHTPGPWEVSPATNGEGLNVYGGSHKDRSGSVAYLVAKLPYTFQAETNARLIAAAPLQDETLRDILQEAELAQGEWLGVNPDYAPEWVQPFKVIAEKARVALAAVRGSQ